ncbi:MAG: ABC transporter permease [Candidatus Coatesbacteria bacterium]|nr:ABC transporter permease [Candidatus Coatesbacteria bacterium]
MTTAMRSLFISRKDLRSYYGKPPLITWGLLFPAVLILAIYVRDPENYLATAPGIIAMTLLFGCTSMAAIVLTFEKRTGSLQRLLLAPISDKTILLGKGLSAAVYGIGTSLVLTLALVLFLGMRIQHLGVFALGVLFGGCIFSILGLCLAATVREVFEAMTLLNFIRFPMLFISGVFLPIEKLPIWLKPLALVSPMTYVVDLLRFGSLGHSYFPNYSIPASIAVISLFVAWRLALFTFRTQARK